MHKRTVPQSVFDSLEALRVARLGHVQACRDLARIPVDRLDPGNPNHPLHSGLFGQDPAAFMARQYKP